LKQAVKLADLLCTAFNTPTGIPDNILNFNGGQPTINGSASASIATIGSLVLEWARLSHLTNDPKYARLTQTAQQFLLKPAAGGEPFPGLLGQYVRLADGAIIDQKGGWGPESDSFYEYLIKMYVYKPSDFANYRDRWTTAADSSMQYLASRPATRPQSTLMAHFDGTKVLPIGWHRELDPCIATCSQSNIIPSRLFRWREFFARWLCFTTTKLHRLRIGMFKISRISFGY
jgi:mannosyl-oligosaccharide alpha-1,2-mannosidase